MDFDWKSGEILSEADIHKEKAKKAVEVRNEFSEVFEKRKSIA